MVVNECAEGIGETPGGSDWTVFTDDGSDDDGPDDGPGEGEGDTCVCEVIGGALVEEISVDVDVVGI